MIVTGITDTGMAEVDAVAKNPFATFRITGTTADGESFNYKTSLDRKKKNYLPGLFGSYTQDGNTELFVEELYYNSLDDLNNAEKVLGLDGSFVEIDMSIRLELT